MQGEVHKARFVFLRPRLSLPRASAMADGLVMPQITPATVAALALGVLALLFAWGWLFLRSYYRGGFGLEAEGIVSLGDAANLTAGLVHVLPLALKALITAPLFLLAGLGMVIVARELRRS